MNGRNLVLAGRLGWRNLWRNPRRTVITTLAVGAGMLVLIVLSGLLAGVKTQLLRNSTDLVLGHVQVHHAEYMPDRHVADTIPAEDLEELLGRITASPEVTAAAPRIRAYGLISTGDSSAGGQLLGVDPDRELRLTTLLREVNGEGLSAEPGGFGMVLGVTLAREIGAEIGSELAVVSQAADGSMGNELFTVTGLVRTGTRSLDRTLAVAHLADLQWMLALGPEDVHEIVMMTADPFAAAAVAEQLDRDGLFPDTSRVRSWAEMAPQLRDYVAMNEGFSRFLVMLVALFAAFGVANTMLMSVYERMREFGTVNALGAQPGLLLVSLMAEAMSIAVMGLTIGLAAGAVVMRNLIHRGWDLTRWTGELSVMDTRFDPILRGVWVWEDVARAAVGLALAALIAVVFAGGRILRLDPVRAMAAPTEG